MVHFALPLTAIACRPMFLSGFKVKHFILHYVCAVVAAFANLKLPKNISALFEAWN
jgi:hypothetical protein